jgi:peptidoglycan hydrolase-like protein with peptidoglycan-binding domain
MKKTYALLIVMCSLVAVSPVLTNRAYSANSGCVTLTTNVALGSKDATSNGAVTQLQSFLQAQKLLAPEPTGFFGSMTLKAVKDFQVSQKLPPVGNTGPMTRAAILKVSCATIQVNTTPAPTLSPVPPKNVTANVSDATLPAPTPKTTLPYHATTFPAWKGTWGAVTITPTDTLRISATETAKGSEAIYPLGSEWTNYRYTATVVVINGDITLISRYVDKDNFIGCTFNANWIGITERVKGVTRTVASDTLSELSTSNFFPKYTSVSMRVTDNKVGCIEIGTEDNLTYTLPAGSPLTKGTIGIETYGQGGATLELREVRVDPI